MSTLITFLGRVPKAENGYRKTCYDFGDEGDVEGLSFFGWALQRRLRPRRMVILGTAGSMWDHLFEGDLDLGARAEEERLGLVDAVEGKCVSQSILDDLTEPLSHQLGCEMRLRTIPYCRDTTEQAEVLRILAGEIGQGETIDLDVTHGFRHLPMLGLLAALHLRRVRDATIRDIWYGAFDPDSGRAPVTRLGGLLDIADWLDALSAYERGGDYGVFGDLIGGKIGRLLTEASFLEGVSRIGQARSRLKRALGLLAEQRDDPALNLFREELERRIGWARGKNYYLRQRELAREYLQNKRYRDAVLTGWEAFTTSLLHETGGQLDPDNHADREQVRKAFDSREKRVSPRSARYTAFDSLRRLRNAIAHGSQPKGDEVQRALSSPEEMERLLAELFDRLLPEAA